MSSGRIVLNPVVHDTQPTPPAQSGSHIQAAAGALETKNSTLVDAVKNLGGSKMGGKRRRRRRRLHGGAVVEVPKVPKFVSAGGVDASKTYASLLETAHAAKAAGAYDGLGNETPINMNHAGGRRKRSVKRNNGRRRSKRATLLRSRRTRRRSRSVRASRR